MVAPGDWAAIVAARLRRVARLAFFVQDGGHAIEAGSVALAHLDALRGWAPELHIAPDRVTLSVPATQRNAFLAQANGQLRQAGLITGWRDESYALRGRHCMRQLGHMERAATRFWGTLTCGAHATGYLADASGRPSHVWIAQRAANKATDGGLFDNLIGGGMALGQSARQALVREGWEEAGLSAPQMRAARLGRVLQLERDVPEGLQLERLYSFDLRLPKTHIPLNQDGEVAGFQCLPVRPALALAASPKMTVDASLVTLDFALRRKLLERPQGAAVEAATAHLWCG